MFRRLPSPVVFVLALALAASGCADTQPDAPRTSLAPEVVTAAGTLLGELADSEQSVLVWRGVPFAAPPIGEQRFTPPTPVRSWQGTRDATTFGAACWQALTPDDSIYSRGEFERSEDCLFLNLWTAASSPNERRPVMVWFHGGSHLMGHAHSRVFDGTVLAEKGAVVVTANYRLGALGFLAHPALTAESEHASSGNYGLLDKIGALEWVRDNIASFGGDPDKVTVFGQSAGSLSVCALQASPLAKGLLHRVIGQSGSCLGVDLPLESAEGRSAHRGGIAIAQHLGIESPEAADASVASALRAVSPEALLAAAAEVGGYSIIVDGWVIPKPPPELFAAGEHNRASLLLGSTPDEGLSLFGAPTERSREEIEAEIVEQYGPAAPALLESYAAELERSPADAQQRMIADRMFTLGARTWAELVEAGGDDVYLYYFTRVPPVFRIYQHENPVFAEGEGPGPLGAYHSGDLAYAFGTTRLLGAQWQKRDHELAAQMSQYWVNFARTGDPNGPGLPEWPPFESDTRRALELGDEIRAHDDLLGDKLAALEAAEH